MSILVRYDSRVLLSFITEDRCISERARINGDISTLRSEQNLNKSRHYARIQKLLPKGLKAK